MDHNRNQDSQEDSAPLQQLPTAAIRIGDLNTVGTSNPAPPQTFHASDVEWKAQAVEMTEEGSAASHPQRSEPVPPHCIAPPAYSSYIQYLQAIRKIWPRYEELYQLLKYKGSEAGAFRVLIADSGSKGIKKNIYASDPAGLSWKPETEVRMIVVELAKQKQASSHDIIDAIGVLYDIDPAFFDAFYRLNRGDTELWPLSLTARNPLPHDKRFLRLHGCMVAQVLEKYYRPGGSLKIVLILSWMSVWRPLVQGIALGGSPTIQRKSQQSISQLSTYSVSPHRYDCCWFSEIYSAWLTELSQNERDLKNRHSLEFVYPWVEYQIYDVVSEIRRLRDELLDGQHNFFTLDEDDNEPGDIEFFGHARGLKETLADVTELRSVFRRLRNADHTQVSKALQDLIDFIDDVVEDANQLLRLMTETQQTFIGAMAIRESRRSIREAVSVKRLTQLAFVFIPLSYVSSIFGMNINELTGNGPNLWLFLVTSFLLLIGALTFWGLSSKIEAAWTRHMRDRIPDKTRSKILMEIFYSGVRTGNFIWMIRSGVFLGLLTRNRFGDKKGTYNKAHAKFFGKWAKRRRQKHDENAV